MYLHEEEGGYVCSVWKLRRVKGEIYLYRHVGVVDTEGMTLFQVRMSNLPNLE